ncbi:aldo/keto reductase [Konateibacter massiliensis]|uniref:aldo/keto reductase n=1 Tax=Konateibacter massiliensis TaxID=2002841 RepID=UPI000C15588B|nr:aldo/keto reductase [Konateibacter massiliensis]
MSNSNFVITLNDGLKLPSIGFGTYSLNGARGAESMKQAIDIGYRLIDSAFNYENEGAVGKAIKQCSVPRGDLIVTSKLPGRHHKYEEALTTIEESLYRADLDYYDLYLIHWPNPITDRYVEAWQALIEAKKRGYVRSIGVCNFLPEHLERLINETGIAPSINQIELHPYFNQEKQLQWNKEHQIATESWSPLERGRNLLSESVILDIANIYKKTPTQVVLRWHIDRGALPIPKAFSKEHQIENLDIFDFELTSEEIAAINKLSRPDGRINNQDPSSYEEF